MAETIAEWLDRLGLGQYAQAFADNGVELHHLPHLKDDDLKELGLPLGPRRHLQAAVEILSARQSTVRPSIGPTEDHGARTAEAERRQLTVLFCDLVGSTALSARLDPEDYRAVMRAYQEIASAAVARYDGHVAKYLGDGVLAYFGWPRAHEDDAERAVRAALGMIAALEARGTRNGEALQARVGIATGTVVVGDIVGAGVAEAGAVSGETPNLAARLQALAAPGSVIVADATHRLLRGVFDCRDLGPHELKGIAKEARVWRVAGERVAETRFDAARAERLTAMVGREKEIALLAERWDRAKEGEGQVVLLAGEAGIGKSRITQALREHLADEPHTRLRFQCSPHHAVSALQPFIAQLERAAGFALDDTPGARLDKLERLLARSTEDVARVAPLFATLLSLPAEGRYPALGLVPQRQKHATLEAMTDQLVGLAARQPVLVIFEDVHWADPTTLEALEHLVGRIEDARVLAVITFRPDFTPPWRGHAYVTSLELNRLTRAQCAAMVERVTGGKALPAEVLDQIVSKTDGVPLFVEELTKTVIELGLLADAGDRFVLSGPLPPFAIPTTLQDSLMARLDRLALVKEVAQIGAAIGREFPYRLLAAVSQKTEDELDAALAQLLDAELVFRRGAGDSTSYIFKHALVQDAAYASLLKSRRQQLHRDIAAALLHVTPEIAEIEPEILAHHYTEAGLVAQAFEHWRRAGKRAIRRSAEVEAVVHLRRALTQLASLPETPERDASELDLMVTMTSALIATKGYASVEVSEANARALALCNRLGDASEVFPALYGRWTSLFTTGRSNESHASAREMLRRAQVTRAELPQLIAHRLVGTSALVVGLLSEAQESLQVAENLWTDALNEAAGSLYGQDVRVGIDAYLSLTLWHVGYADQALQHAKQAETRARRLRHANTLGYALFHTGWLYGLTSRYATLEGHGRLLIELGERHAHELWGVAGRLFLSWKRIVDAPDRETIAQFEQALVDYRATQMDLTTPLFVSILAEGYGRAGLPERGLSVIDEALALVEERGGRLNEAELHRTGGAIEQGRGDTQAAETRFKKAIAVARGQQNRSFELRAAVSLARFWCTKGRTAEARDLLVPVYGWFTEGFETADVSTAKALLDALH